MFPKIYMNSYVTPESLNLVIYSVKRGCIEGYSPTVKSSEMNEITQKSLVLESVLHRRRNWLMKVFERNEGSYLKSDGRSLSQ